MEQFYGGTGMRVTDTDAAAAKLARIRTVRVVAGHAHDSADARLLLDTLGLDPRETPPD